MTTLKTSLTDAVQTAASKAGLKLVSTTEGKDSHGRPTAVFELAPASGATTRTLHLELSEQFDFNKPELLPAMTAHLAEEAKRLRNPRPDADVTFEGLPISFRKFQWPFHRSTSGSDTYVVHGEIALEDGENSALHAKVSASMTVTFAEIVPAPEQPYAESFIYNAVRKTLDYGQLELVKSGNRQPVPVTTRYYSRWQKKFVFTDTDTAKQTEFLLMKAYWLSGVLGQNQPVWITDPRDAQYLNTTPEELLKVAQSAAGQGLLKLDGEYAAATESLMARSAAYQAKMQAALAITKPTFNEEMRAGHANM
ncbi:MAG TPA: hypothetical protein VL346_09045 [Acidobacteriaceae bacterium]|nr:hypothetical protein [Acidobacteriaceae bacterium]